ncbi:MAG: DUF2335 domain-containing protein [Saprospiraceae bacterium]|uniref:DUF2335 domain-containing protein n=1 Tax=Candidatus Opimibacter skivensis TaxID=2982028 RepID=A0A9D7T2M5_9BACT|nr:DUF2335 domain-containing protein [Candidatus Opimibacter skivensis]
MRDMLLQLPADKRKEILSFVSIAITKSSPLPDPATFKSYNDIDPSITKVIMEDFEKTREHRRTLEALSVTEHVKYKRRGQYCGVAIVLGFLAAGALVAIFSNVVAGSIIAGAGLYIALARSFLRANLFGKGEDEVESKTPPKKKAVKS